MFKFAQAIVRHKIGVLAIIAIAAFVFSRDGHDRNAKPASPWARQTVEMAAADSASDKDSLISSTVGKAVDVASDYVGEKTGVDPKALAESNSDNWNKTAEAMVKANKGE